MTQLRLKIGAKIDYIGAQIFRTVHTSKFLIFTIKINNVPISSAQ